MVPQITSMDGQRSQNFALLVSHWGTQVTVPFLSHNGLMIDYSTQCKILDIVLTSLVLTSPSSYLLSKLGSDTKSSESI